MPTYSGFNPERKDIVQRILFVMDHISQLQEKKSLRFELIGRDPSALSLAGQKINGFAGFFEQKWREYDYRRGRLEGWTAFQCIFGQYPKEDPTQQPTNGRTIVPGDEYDTPLFAGTARPL
jgi:hypothetical protein